jgi:hypothetical protein
MENVVKRLKEAIDPPLKAIKEVSEAVREWVSVMAPHVMQQVVQVAQPVINLFIPPFQVIKKSLSFGLRWLKDKQRQGFWNMHKKMQKFLKHAVPIVDDLLEKAKRRFSKIWSLMLEPLMRFLERWLPSIPRFFRFIKRVLGNTCRPLIHFAHKKLHQFVDFLIDQLDRLVKAPHKYLLGIIKKIVKLSIQSVKVCAIIVIGIGLVFKFWFEMLYEVSEEITKKIRLQS